MLGQDIGRLNERQRLRLRAQRHRHRGAELRTQPAAPRTGHRQPALRAARPGGRRSDRNRVSRELLALTGLEHHAKSPVYALSGGEQQRLSLAVALAGAPRLLLADEPTSQLDPHSRDYVIDLLRPARDRTGVTVIVVTHDLEVGAAMDRSMAMRDGRLGVEHRAGELFGVVAPDGSVQLPADLAAMYPSARAFATSARPATSRSIPVTPADGDPA